MTVWQVVGRTVLAMVIGAIIGSERARHGRAAGIRTHILVALGAALTAMISLFARETLGYEGDVLRLSAQVISGIGFLGVGMIIQKNNNVITGLTTAAGVWTTGVIGIAVGCGFYLGAALAAGLYMVTVTLLGRLERRKIHSEVVYVELDDMYRANAVVEAIQACHAACSYQFLPPKSGCQGHLGVSLLIENRRNFDVSVLKAINNIVFIEEE